MPSSYGILISIGILISLLVAEQLLKKDKHPTDSLWTVALYVLIGSFIGARLYHVIDYMEYYLAQPAKIVAVWEGGLGIWGGIIGGFVTLWAVAKKQKVAFTFWADLFATVLPLGQAIGRWGNYVNQENFGYPSTLPWGIFIEQKNRPFGFESFSHFHPLFFYESVLSLILFFVLLKRRSTCQKRPGAITAYYLMGYATIRFILDFWRLQQWYIGPFIVSQLISVAIFLLAFGYLFRLKMFR